MAEIGFHLQKDIINELSQLHFCIYTVLANKTLAASNFPYGYRTAVMQTKSSVNEIPFLPMLRIYNIHKGAEKRGNGIALCEG